LLKEKQAGFKPPKAKEQAAAPRNVISLMDALRRSVKEESSAPASKSKKKSKRAAGQTEMLLPIEGKGSAREAAAKARPAAPKKAAARRKAG
jgi:DNA end-binding protein Ku